MVMQKPAIDLQYECIVMIRDDSDVININVSGVTTRRTVINSDNVPGIVTMTCRR